MSMRLLLYTVCSFFVRADVELSPKELQAQADMAIEKGDFPSGFKYYNKLIRLAPSQLAYFKRASAYIKKKEWDKAIQDFSKSVDLDPKFYKGYVSRAKVSMLTGRCVEAQADVDVILKENPKNKQILKLIPDISACANHVRAADDSERQGKLDEAKTAITAALQIAYQSVSLLLRRANIHMTLKDHQSVLVDTRELLQQDKTNVAAMEVRAEAFYRMGDHEVAMNHYKEGLRLDPERREMKDKYNALKKLMRVTAMAEKLIAEKQLPQAAASLEEAVEVDPSNRLHNVQLLIKLCRTWRQQADSLTDEERKVAARHAIAACNRAINLDAAHGESNLSALVARGEAYIALEEWQLSINDMQAAINIDGNSQEARQGLNKAEVEKKKSERKDYYKILGVPKNADDRAIKKAFRKLAVQYHPDKHQDQADKDAAEKIFKDVVEAHDVLSDEEARGKYDRGEDIQPTQRQGPQSWNFGGQQFHFRYG